MKTPPFLLGASLLFWGLQTGLLFLSIILALVLEGSRLVPWRWNLSDQDFRRISDFCTLVFLSVALHLYLTKQSAEAVLTLFEWLPLVFFLLVAAQVYSAAEKIAMSALFLVFRRRAARKTGLPPKAVNLAFPYFALCILSASVSNIRTLWFYASLFLLSSWALWNTRSSRYPVLLWASLLLFTGAIGYGGSVGLYKLQGFLAARIEGWLIGRLLGEADPYKSNTSIGSIGKLKLSGRVVMRVAPTPGQAPPVLLRDASYNLFNSGTWFATHPVFSAVLPEEHGMTWDLTGDIEDGRTTTVSAYLKKGGGLLAVPGGTFRIERLPVGNMKQSRLGSVMIEDGPGLITYEAHYQSAVSLNGAPDETDLNIPEKEVPALSRIAKELKLSSKSPSEVLKILDGFFRSQFVYSKYYPRVQDGRDAENTPLADFLLRTQAGHCEYFATATVLLLRQAGIPARYATGYAVQEFSRLENMFVVRGRHAHSWALAYIGDSWVDVDTTPSSWISIEEEGASLWELVYDLASRVMFLFSRWQLSERDDAFMRSLGWFLIPVVAFLLWRFYFKKKGIRLKKQGTHKELPLDLAGSDSEFYLVVKRLGEMGITRIPGETLSRWIQRMEDNKSFSSFMDPLRSMLNLHYRYRFDPHGISIMEKTALGSDVRQWLLQHQVNEPSGQSSESKEIDIT